MSLQTDFTASVLNPNAPIPDGVSDPNGQACPKRFSVYRNNVVHSLISALSDAYPAIMQDVGPEFFEAMAGLYVRQNPPKSPLMMFYGQDFSSFLRGFKPAAQREYLVDLAQLEASMRDAYHAADDAILDPKELSGLEGDDLMSARFGFRSSAILLKSSYPVLSIWMYQMQGTTMPDQAGTENILITRPALDVQMVHLTAAQYVFFDRLKGGIQLGEAFDTALSIQPDFDLGAALGLAFQSSCFSQFQ